MKTTITILAVLTLWVHAENSAVPSTVAPWRNPLVGLLPDPADLLSRHAAFQLSDTQQQTIRTTYDAAAAVYRAKDQQLRALAEELAAALRKQPSDEAAVRAKFEVILAKEAEVKLLRFETLVKIRALLTPEQRTQLESEAAAKPAK